jgi:hypothetical protein
MSKKMPEGKIQSYEVITHKDETGDTLIPIPKSLLKELGWKPGDNIEFGVDTKGQFILTRKEE